MTCKSNVKKIAMVLCYRPPSSNSELFCSAINNALKAVHNEYDNVCVIGDFNFHLLIGQIIIICQP